MIKKFIEIRNLSQNGRIIIRIRANQRTKAKFLGQIRSLLSMNKSKLKASYQVHVNTPTMTNGDKKKRLLDQNIIIPLRKKKLSSKMNQYNKMMARPANTL